MLKLGRGVLWRRCGVLQLWRGVLRWPRGVVRLRCGVLGWPRRAAAGFRLRVPWLGRAVLRLGFLPLIVLRPG